MHDKLLPNPRCHVRGVMTDRPHTQLSRALVRATLAWCLLACAASTASAGPWTRDPGRYYAKLSQGMYRAAGYRDGSGRFVDDSTYSAHISSLYAEVGMPAHLQAQFYLPFLVADNAFTAGSDVGIVCGRGAAFESARSSFGDAQLGLQWNPRLLTMPHALRLQAKLPLYALERDVGCASISPQPGDGQVDLGLWAAAGESFADGAFFAFAELGHLLRTDTYLFATGPGGYGQTFSGLGQVGYQFMPGAFAMLSLRTEVPYGSDSITKGWLTFGPQLLVPIGAGLAAELEVGFTPWARNASLGRAEQGYFTQATLGISRTY